MYRAIICQIKLLNSLHEKFKFQVLVINSYKNIVNQSQLIFSVIHYICILGNLSKLIK